MGGLNTIIKRDKRIVPFEPGKIYNSIYKAAQSTGGFKQDMNLLPRDLILELYPQYIHSSEEQIAEGLTSRVISYLEQQKIKRPRVEQVQNAVEHVLANQAFVDVWETYRIYRWSRTAVRKRQITEEQFSESGLPEKKCREISEWNKKNNCYTISDLNEIVKDPTAYKNLIQKSIQKYHQELDNIASLYLENPARIIFIAGPSSSGKTTTTHKVVEKLEDKGYRCKSWTIDNYFRGLVYLKDKFDEFGDCDYETPEALDIRLIRRHLRDLFEGKKIAVPYYNFLKGKREGISTEIKLGKKDILVVDSHFSISPKLFSERVLPERAFKVYIENLNMIENSKGRKVKLTDNRLLRRMLRDSEHRGHSIDLTLGHWHYVRSGELRDLIPYMNTADYIINGGLAFELAILKGKLHDKLPDLEEFRKDKRFDAFIRGNRIKKLFEELETASDENVPKDCHLREFIGGLEL